MQTLGLFNAYFSVIYQRSRIYELTLIIYPWNILLGINQPVVDRSENGSVFSRLNADDLEMWLENDYALGDLWKKNILGGRLSR